MTGTAVTFSGLDWAVVAAYFVLNTVICIWAALLKEKDTTDYFLASRDAGWFLIGSSIFASNIGAEHLIGLAGSGADSGMAFAHWELHSYLVLVLGWVFAPFYLRAKVFTTPEFLERRYTPATRTFLSLIFFVSYILTKASVTIFAGAFAIQTILGYQQVNMPLLGEVDFFWFAAFSLVTITGVFVIVGGMKSVLWTEAMHVPVLLAGSAVLLIVGLTRPIPRRYTSGVRSRPRLRPRDFRGSCSIRARRRGSACCSLRRSSACGTGVRINTSCSAYSLPGISEKHGAARCSPAI
jgi:solute:Na+ symporter, SSS family